MQLQQGQSIGRYHILEQVGQGGMAFVYKAYDTRLEREVAIKIIRTGAFPPDVLDRVLKRFEREAKALARLNHPNIVKVHDYGEFDDAPFLVMDFLPGANLKNIEKPVPWQDAIRILEPIADALAYAHEQGILHRDVKPSNIILTNTGIPVLTDFGISKLLDNSEEQTLTATGVGVGTPEYMAPEQGLGKGVDGRADLYSLGIVLYELITGRKPYQADTPLAVLLKQVNDPLPRPREYVPDLPDPVEQVLFKALAKDPKDRFKDMRLLIKALKELSGRNRNDEPEIKSDKNATKPTSEETIDDFVQPRTPHLFDISDIQHKSDSNRKIDSHPVRIKKKQLFWLIPLLFILIGAYFFRDQLFGFSLSRQNERTSIPVVTEQGAEKVFTPSVAVTLSDLIIPSSTFESVIVPDDVIPSTKTPSPTLTSVPTEVPSLGSIGFLIDYDHYHTANKFQIVDLSNNKIESPESIDFTSTKDTWSTPNRFNEFYKYQYSDYEITVGFELRRIKDSSWYSYDKAAIQKNSYRIIAEKSGTPTCVGLCDQLNSVTLTLDYERSVTEVSWDYVNSDPSCYLLDTFKAGKKSLYCTKGFQNIYFPPNGHTNPSYIDEYPVINPFGTKFAYLSSRKGYFQVAIYDLENNSDQVITKNMPKNGFHPAWSSDGTLLIYVLGEIDSDNSPTEICYYNLNSKSTRCLPEGKGKTRKIYPSFSPDNKMITYSELIDGHYQIVIYDIDGNFSRQVTFTNTNNLLPIWIK